MLLGIFIGLTVIIPDSGHFSTIYTVGVKFK